MSTLGSRWDFADPLLRSHSRRRPIRMTEPVSLLTPLQLGAFALAHRMVLPSMTRCRADAPGGVPNDLMASYYAQRASPGGLLVAEAAYVSALGHHDPTQPGLYTPSQVNRWREVTDAVHAKGGIILAQLSFRSHGTAAESAGSYTGQEAHSSMADLDFALESYRNAAENAGDAGFDGVELHGDPNVLPYVHQIEMTDADQDLAVRTAIFAGIVDTLCAVWSADKVGLCFPAALVMADAPSGRKAATARDMAYLHLQRPWQEQAIDAVDKTGFGTWLRSQYRGATLLSGRFSVNEANGAVAGKKADAIGFGRAFIANPDLPDRIRRAVPLNNADVATFYSGGDHGYTDYATSEEP